MLKLFLVNLLLSGMVFAQDAVEVDRGKICISNDHILSVHNWDGKHLRNFPIPVSRPGDPRPKYRAERWWISNGQKIGCIRGRKIEWLILPNELERFSDFDVPDADTLLVWGAQWRQEKGKDIRTLDPEALPFLAVIDLGKGTVRRTYFAPPKAALQSYFDAAREYEGYCFKYEDTYVFVGKYSGKLRFYEPLDAKHWEMQCVDPERLPLDPETGVNSGEFIPSVYPIEGGELLLHVRWWLPKGEQAPATKQDWFQILDPVNKKLGEIQLSHRDQIPGKAQFWVDGSGRTHTLR